MPIKGMSDGVGSLPRLGTLRKGEPKQKDGTVGRDRETFRFTSKLADIRETFEREYGKDVATVDAILPYATVEENFQSWREVWGKSSGLLHKCDGVTTVSIQLPDGTISYEPQPCPGGCRQQGKLKIILPRLGRFGIIEVLTTSSNDARNINGSLVYIRDNILAGARDQDSSKVNMMGTPIIVARRPETIYPLTEKGRIKKISFLIAVELHPSWMTNAMNFLQGPERLLLPSNQPKQYLLTSTGEIEL